VILEISIITRKAFYLHKLQNNLALDVLAAKILFKHALPAKVKK
jgi:hypothetical protein